jgi:hypothetical protein
MTANWANEEFETIDLGDKRLDERLKMLAETLSDKPGASIPAAWADRTGTVRGVSVAGARGRRPARRAESASRVRSVQRSPILRVTA